MPKKLLKTDENVETYAPDGREKDVQEFLSSRIEEMKNFRKEELRGNNRSIEDIMKSAEQAYQPKKLKSKSRKVLQSDDIGQSARYVELGGSNWQAIMSSPDLYVKVNTALSILIDQNPEAVFTATSKKYEKNTQLAQSNWKNSWEYSNGKQQLKQQIFDSCMYGTGIMRTYPKMVKLDKKILSEYYPDIPEKNKYDDKVIVKYNDLCREAINPMSVWFSENARMADYLSIDDWYFEKEYTIDKFKQDFNEYANKEYVKGGMVDRTNGQKSSETDKNKVTVGFYENQVKDLYTIYIPSSKIVIYQSPLQNDDGLLSLSVSQWTSRGNDCIWGIGLWEIIQQDSEMYDRFNNMTLDQLALAIYKMFFYEGTDLFGENSQLVITPGKGEQVKDSSKVKFLEIPGPGNEAWQGLQFIQDKKDNNSGVTPQLSAKFSGKTLGQDIQAKEAALERMKTPLEYIMDSLQQEALVTLSWQKQILSTPEIVAYTDVENLQMALQEMGLDEQEIQAYLQEVESPSDKGLMFNSEPDEMGNVQQFANVYKEQSYNLDKDEKGNLIESKDSRFYRFGLDLPTNTLDWRGIIRIKPQSVLTPSKELTKRMKLDLYNLVYPSIQAMLAKPQDIPMLMPSIKQIIKVYDEDVKDWMDEDMLEQLAKMAMQPQKAPVEPPKLSVSIQFETLTPDVQMQMLEKYADIKIEKPLFVDANAPQIGATMPQNALGSMPQNALGSMENANMGKSLSMKPLVPRERLNSSSSNENMIAKTFQIE